MEKPDEFQPVTLRFMMGGIDLNTFSQWLGEYDKDRNVTTIEHIDGYIHLSTAYTWDPDKKWALAPLFKDAVEKGILNEYDTNYFQIFTVPGMPDTIAFNCPRIIDYRNSLEVKNISKALLLARQNIYRYLQFCRIYFPGFENAFISNIADMLGVRVSRRIKGKYIYTIDDLLNGKKFEHPVVVSDYPVDVHSNTRGKSTLKAVKDYQEIDDVLFKFSLNLPDEQIPLVIDKLHIALDGIMKPVTSGFGFIDLIIPGLHKANGISRLLKRWDLSPQNVVAIGDSGNDAEMLKMARYSFAMGNAAENIKQIARYATDDNNHEGALNVIQAVLDNTSPFNS